MIDFKACLSVWVEWKIVGLFSLYILYKMVAFSRHFFR